MTLLLESVHERKVSSVRDKERAHQAQGLVSDHHDPGSELHSEEFPTLTLTR